MRRVVLGVVLISSAAFAEPGGAPCESALYAAPSLMAGGGSVDSAPWYVRMPSTLGAVLGRLSAGALIVRCDDADAPALQLRVGLTAHVSTLHFTSNRTGDAGAGLEAEADLPIGVGRSFGGRVAVESASTGNAIVTLGARFHLSDAVWFGLDGYAFFPHHDVDCSDLAVPGCGTHAFGITAGAGLEVHPGGFVREHKLVIGGALLVVGGIVTAIAIAAQGFHL